VFCWIRQLSANDPQSTESKPTADKAGDNRFGVSIVASDGESPTIRMVHGARSDAEMELVNAVEGLDNVGAFQVLLYELAFCVASRVEVLNVAVSLRVVVHRVDDDFPIEWPGRKLLKVLEGD